MAYKYKQIEASELDRFAAFGWEFVAVIANVQYESENGLATAATHYLIRINSQALPD